MYSLLKAALQVGYTSHFDNGHLANGWMITILCALNALAQPAFAAPQHVVSTFLCTDEYVFRLVPRERIAALSYEATDRNPVVSTIADRARGIRTIHPSTETVLSLAPDLVVMYAGTNPRLHLNLKKLGIAVLDVPWANSLADVRTITTMLGEKLGAPGSAKEMLAGMDRKIAAARAAPQTRLTRMGTLPVEAVIAAAPELLILGGEERSGSARAYMILHHPALKALKGKTYMEHAVLTPLLCPGPWSLDAAETFGNLARKTRALAPMKAPN